jgi:D-2-hydroxyacid dehydrogenase (NADP+)
LKPNILITSPMSSAYVEKLNADPKINQVKQLPRELWEKFAEFYHLGDKVAEIGPQEFAPFFEEADVIVCVGLPYRSIDWSPNLKWVQAWSAGVDHMKMSGVLEAGIPVTTLAGLNAIPVAEHVMMFMLMLAKKYNTFSDNASKHIWRPAPATNEINGKTIGIFGLGAIGKHVARMAKGFDMNVIATKRTITSSDQLIENVDELLPTTQFDDLIARSDYLILSCPLSDETRGIMNEEKLKKMKPESYLINVSRGEVVDEQSLVKALKEGWIAGAGLDVYINEPLEDESELWQQPNLVATSHRAGRSTSQQSRATDLFEKNIDLLINGETLINVVDPDRQY